MTASPKARDISTRWGISPDQAQTFVDAYGDEAEKFVKAAAAVGARTYREFAEKNGAIKIRLTQN